MSASPDDVHAYFAAYGWQYEYDPVVRVWYTGFRGRTGQYSLFVQLTPEWIVFSIAPLVTAPTDPRCRDKLATHLLRLNFVINMAKLSLDDDGDVILTVEIPAESLTYELFEDALGALSYYADTHYLELLNTAQDPDYVPPALPGVGQAPPSDEGGELN
jgi:hypothetical protein